MTKISGYSRFQNFVQNFGDSEARFISRIGSITIDEGPRKTRPGAASAWGLVVGKDAAVGCIRNEACSD